MPRPRRKNTYGSGGVSRDGAGWRIRWRDGGRRSQSGFETRDLAEAALRIKVADLQRGRAGLPPDPKHVPTIAALAPKFFDERSGPHNRNNEDERRKFNNHLLPELGRLRPDEVTPAGLEALAAKLVKGGRVRRRKGDPAGLSRATAKQLMAILSSFYTWLIVKGHASRNPWQLVPRKMRRNYKTDYTALWRNRPWVKKKTDIHRIYAALPRWTAIAFAIGVNRGPRPGEIRALTWTQLDLEANVFHIVRQVRNGRIGPPKGGHSRTLTVSNRLRPILAEWHLVTGGKGLVIPPRRRRFPREGGCFISEKAFNQELRKVLRKLELPEMTWYEATRHTFASQFVRDGGSLEVLATILGQSSTEVTRRYSHLQSDQIRKEDTERAQVDLSPGEVVALRSVPNPEPWDELGTAGRVAEEGETSKNGGSARTSGP